MDGVTLAVMTNRFQGVVSGMMNTLLRSARSGVINTARDFSCCVITQDNDMLVAGESLPIHVMSGPELMGASIDRFHPHPKRGDAFLHNSPYHGCSHAADLCIVVPVIDDEGIKRFSVISKAHQADIGSSVPTTYMVTARDVYEEGALIFPGVKVQEDYKDIDDIVRMCQLRIRVPDQWWGDYLALVGSARTGERRIMELAAEFGWDMLEEYAGAWFDYSEQRMMAAIRQIPKKTIRVETWHDPFPVIPDGIPVRAEISVDPDEGFIDVDLRDNVDCQPCGLNLSEAVARTEVMVGLFNSIPGELPPNAGSFRRIRIRLRENCMIGIPTHPYSCSAATVQMAHRVVNAVQRGMSEISDVHGLAESALIATPAQAVISGLDPRHGNKPFVNQVFLDQTGFGASPVADGWLYGSPGSGGQLLRDSIEIDEIHHPIRIHARKLVPDREGAGTFCGAPGGYLEYGPVGCEMEVMYASDGNLYPAIGTRGGLPGAPARQLRRKPDGELVPLPQCSRELIRDGETVVCYSGGAGGYGSPLKRDPERVRRDLLDGRVSAGRARSVYGVALAADGSVDQDETARLRGTEPGEGRRRPGVPEASASG